LGWNTPSPTREITEDLKMLKEEFKKLDELDANLKEWIVGFLDETSPQPTTNTQRLWSFNKPAVKKKTTR